MSNESVDVVIAGLGPTGLVLAHLLGRCGHEVVVLEREPRFYGNARAVYTDDECMRVFQAAGLARKVQEKMLLETPCQWVAPDGSVMGQYMPRQRPYGWPVVNFFYQPYLETTMAEELARHLNVAVRRGRELTGFVQDDDGVTVTHQATREFRFTDGSDARMRATGPDDPRLIRARYLIGADGGRSVVRERLGISMSGTSFPEPWLVVDLKAKNAAGEEDLRHIPYFNFYCDPDRPAVSCPQPDGHHRFEFRLKPGQTKEYMERPDTVREHVARFVDPDRFEVKRRLVYTFNALVADKWRNGRVLIAGDAAHMTPQFMGQGMSSGVRDAQNLAWKLDLVLRGKASEALFDSYEIERRAHAKAMIDISVQMKDFVSMSSPIRAMIRNAVVAIIRATPPLRRWVETGGFKPTPTYAPGYFGVARTRRSGPEGRLIPQPEVRRFDGRRVLLDEVLGDGFSLLGLGVDPLEHLSAATREYLDALGTSYAMLHAYGQRPQGERGSVGPRPPELAEVEDMDGEMVRWFERAGFSRNAIAVIRPDKFLFGIAHAPQIERITDQLRAQLGPGAPVPGRAVTTRSAA